MAAFQYSTIDKYVINAKCDSPLHIGSSAKEDNSVLIDPVSRFPFIQATGIAGVLRDASLKINGVKETEALFGHSGNKAGDRLSDTASRVRITDGTFDRRTVRMELRPRVKIDAETGTVSSSPIGGSGSKSGHKFETEYVGKGSEFEFFVYLFGGEGKEALEKTLGALASGQLQFGGLKSNGGGTVLAGSICHRIFDLSAKEGREKWSDEENLPAKDYENITERLKKLEGSPVSFDIVITGKTESGLLVKGIAVTQYGKGAPDSMNMQDSADNYIVPGSSFKGVLRSRMSYIAEQIGCGAVLDDAFGVESKKDTTGKDGNLHVFDAVVGNREQNDKAPIQHRIHVDKFTAGVINGGLFSQKNAFGKLELRIQIIKKRDPEAVMGLLMLALRDLSLGFMNIGSGYSIGNGFIDVDRIAVASTDGRKADIYPGKQLVEDPDGLIAACLGKLEGRR